MKLPNGLEKYLSKEALTKAIELIKDQPKATTPEQGNTNHDAVVEGVVQFVETLDDKVSLIPFVGPILRAIVDSPDVDNYERHLVEMVVELAYQTLKLNKVVNQ